jgi:hypothetical protein
MKMADKKNTKKPKIVIKNFDPEKYVDVEPAIYEAKKNTIVVSFGRMNPITTGHEKLVNALMREAAKRRAEAAIYLSHTQDKKKNPLSYDQKISLGQKAFGRAVKKSNARTIIEVAKELSGKYNNLVVVVGSDRVAEFERLLNTYNGREYNYENIEVVSAGERDPDADDVTGMSASKLRGLAAEGKFNEFRRGLPKKLQSSAQSVYDMVRSGLGMNEELEEETLMERPQLSIAQRRKRGLVMKRYKTKIAAARKRAARRKAPPEKLKKRAQRRALEFMRQRLMKGKKYSEMSPAEKVALDKRLARVPQRVIDRIARRLIPQVRQAEMERLKRVLSGPKNESIDSLFENVFTERTVKPQDPDVKDMPGSQPKGYYRGVKKSVKDDRARHFAKHAKMDDDNPAAYKPAPGDKGAETKPSVHTKRFKQMFGEASCADMKVRKRPHMALEKNGSVKFDKRFKIYRPKNEINESAEEITEDLVNLMLDMDIFIMSEEFDALMEANPTEALKKKAEKTGISYGILKKVFDRGVAAWRTGHRPGTTPTQWGLARVNSFATKGKGTWGKADSDLAAKVRKEEVDLDEVSQALAHRVAKARQAQASNLRQKAIDEPDMMKAFSHTKAANKAEKKAGQSYNRLMKKEEVNSVFKSEGVETTKAKMRIAQEKEADRRKHDRLIDAAKQRDKLARKRMSEGHPDPSKREHGTDSLVKILKGDTPGESKGIKESSPLMKDLPRGARVKFTYKTVTGPDEELEGTVVGTENYPHQGSSDVVSSRGRLRIRDDEGRVYIVKHEDADLVEATKSRGFEGKTITVKNEPVRMIDGTMRRMPPGKSASSKGGNGD